MQTSKLKVFWELWGEQVVFYAGLIFFKEISSAEILAGSDKETCSEDCTALDWVGSVFRASLPANAVFLPRF